jgi:cysteinyl-tRNA synthetase
LRRVVKLAGHEVVHAMNYTDVDDKTIRRSHEKYPNEDPKSALKKLTDEYIALFMDDMRKIGNDVDALTFLRATDDKVIDGMRQLITKLHAGGFAYIADDGVYFSIDAYRKSGKKYGQLLELTLENTSEERIQNDEYDKESAHDFALWKKQKVDEPAWEFALDGQDLTGRPGWHIECSIMSRQALDQPFDIHTGGVDLIFPHHENEIAQSTAGEENPVMAQIFAHNEHILVDGKKMAKSANNFYTLQDIIDRGFDPLAFRLLVLQAHYKSQAHFSWENLEHAQSRLKNYQRMADLQFQAANVAPWLENDTSIDAILDKIQDDLNSPQALEALSVLAAQSEEHLVAVKDLENFQQLLTQLDAVFGLQLGSRKDIGDDQKQLIAEREKIRAEKNWEKSDELRDQLNEQGVGLRDTDHGTIWFRL